MYSGVIDIPSLLLYVLIGIIGEECIKRGKNRHIMYNRDCSYNRDFILFILLFSFFAVFRKIGYRLGGADALSYARVYENLRIEGISSFQRGSFTEGLFYIYELILNFFSSNYKFFFGVTYFIIALSYIFIIKQYSNVQYSTIPFVLLVFPFLKSFCTLRTGFAVALFLFGIGIIRNHKWWSLIILISTVFIQRASASFVLVWFFYHLYHKRFMGISKRRLAIFVAFFVIISIPLSRLLQTRILSSGILYGTDSWYLSISKERSIFEYIPMLLPNILLISVMIIMGKSEKTPEFSHISLLCVFDIILYPANLILGLWRSNEYMYVIRLLMWGMLIPQIESRFTNKMRKLIRILLFALFLIWLIFRICSEWDDLKIMPYVFDFSFKRIS